ncbi:hypothetical protein BDW59DRAFT_156878 [Aspergillus cavernicola]|uniref:Uncharacterized protein n=1 Tax=Aspergillus cavernicola TaxID=176166 RepID=A0ABR4J2T1_9EURO
MSCSIDLGQKIFPSSVSDLNLSLRASASIQLPSQSPALGDSEHLKKALCSGNLWVYQAPELILSICIGFGSESHRSFAHFASQSGDTICKAKMWSELGLSVLYKSCIQRASSTIELSFGIQKRLGPPENTRPPRLPNILKNLGNLHPFADVPTACITSIDVVLEYDYHHHRHIGPSTPSPTISAAILEEADDEDHDMIQTIDHDDLDCDGLYGPPSSIPNGQEIRDSVSEEELKISKGKWDSDSYHMFERFDSKELVTLFREGLKALVWGDASQDNENQARTDAFHSLSRIAPSVFKSRYSDAMNQRSRLISSIAKSLASMIELSDNQQLKGKLASLQTSHNTELGMSTLPPLEDTKTILKTRLWRIAQNKLYKTPTPKQLNPLHSFFDTEQNDHSQDENLLSETVTEETVYFNDDLDAFNHGPDLYPDDSDDLGLKFDDFDFDETGETASSMILEDTRTERSAKTSEECLLLMEIDRGSETISPSYTRHDNIESDHDIAIYDSLEEVDSSQTFFSDHLQLFAEKSVSEHCEEMLWCED